LRFIDRNSYSDSLSALVVDLPNLGEARLLAADLLDIVVIGVRLHLLRIAPLHPADSYWIIWSAPRPERYVRYGEQSG
jgi:hypothetical protein